MTTETKPVDQTTDDKTPELPVLVNWLQFGDRIVAEMVRNHPHLGDAGEPGVPCITTSSVKWINRETKMAQTTNTLYRLENELDIDKLLHDAGRD